MCPSQQSLSCRKDRGFSVRFGLTEMRTCHTCHLPNAALDPLFLKKHCVFRRSPACLECLPLSPTVSSVRCSAFYVRNQWLTSISQAFSLPAQTLALLAALSRLAVPRRAAPLPLIATRALFVEPMPGEAVTRERTVKHQ